MDSFIQDLLSQSSPSPDWPVHSIPTSLLDQQQPLPPQLQCIPRPMESPSPDSNNTNNELPAKIRKKPGRKPNPASPALRKAQNRAAQRAFRERKERHLRDLETTIRTLREQRQQTVKELNSTKIQVDSFRAENWYLKGLVLTLQFICMHHSIQIPTHSPYLTEEALSNIAQSSPHTIEAYVNAYMRNNVNLKPTMATHLANSYQQQQREEEQRETPEEEDDGYDYDDEESRYSFKQEFSTDINDELSSSASPNNEQYHDDTYLTAGNGNEVTAMDEDSDMTYVKQEPRDDELNDWLRSPSSASVSVSPQPQHQERQQKQKEKTPQKKQQQQQQQQQISEESSPTSLSAIQKIRLQLRIQSALSSIGSSTARLQPTLLQLSISHDPRIDLIPTPHMRDRMIIFRDQMDYDRCFTMLLNGAVYHGGDPTMSESWELPPEFFSEFWFLTIDYDIRKTNKWRRVKGLPEIGPSTLNEQRSTTLQQQQYNNNNLWPRDPMAQFVDDMPPLQPMTTQQSNYLMSPPSDFDKLNHPLYQIMGTDPQTRRPERAPTLGAIMELMSSMTATENNSDPQQIS